MTLHRYPDVSKEAFAGTDTDVLCADELRVECRDGYIKRASQMIAPDARDARSILAGNHAVAMLAHDPILVDEGDPEPILRPLDAIAIVGG